MGPRRVLKEFAQYPTEQNEAYAVGYLVSMREFGAIEQEPYRYWLAVVGTIPKSEEVRNEILHLFKESK